MNTGQDPYKYFRVEARELLEQLSSGILDLEKGSATAELVARLFRFAHTLKGAARVVKQREIADSAHCIEEGLGPFREGGVSVSREQINALLELLDAIGHRLAVLTPETRLEAGQSPPREESFRTVRADVAEMDSLLDDISEAHVQLAALRRNLAGLEQAQHLAELLSEQFASPRLRESQGLPRARGAHTAPSLVEDLRGLLATLERNLESSVEQLDRELRQVRDATEKLRLLPASSLFNSLERTLRDAAQTLGKRVTFEGKGGEVGLDTHLLEVIQGALVQLARNAVAHGIESEIERLTAGKPAEGRVLFTVERRGSRVAFLCQDDGQGVDLEAVRRAVQRKGLLPAKTRGLGPEELLRLLLKAGISTSGVVTEVSGRGVGLDVVREAAEQLGGEVTVRTQPGRGTTVELLVPVSLSSVRALLVEAGGVTAAIPLDSIQRTLQIRPFDLAHTCEGQAIVHEGQVIPFQPLTRSLRPAASQSSSPRTWSAVVVRGNVAVAALGVDRLLGTSRVVLRPLPELAPADPVVAGASLDAEGNPQLVLDPEGLVAATRRIVPLSLSVPTPSLPVLVIDDSLTTRMLEQSILESAGYQVALASSAEEGLEKARRQRYALFLVDVEMPGMDGFSFVECTRADALLRDIPAILVTSRSSPEDKQRGKQAGASAYIVKSEFEQTELLEQIRRLVR